MLTTNKIMNICLTIGALPLLIGALTSARDGNSQLAISCPTCQIPHSLTTTATTNVAPWLKPGLLNSVRIELKFGSYGVQILAQDQVSATRLSSLYSLHEGEKITRTLAFTKYETDIDDRLKIAHEEIVAGGSIGATLKKYGFDLRKDLFFKGLVGDMPNQVQTLMHTKEVAFATVMYNLSAKSESRCLPYCTIVEVYAPDFLTIEEVDLIYPESTPEKSNLTDYILNRMRTVIKSL